MARQKKKPVFEHCKVSFTSHPKAPWRVSWPIERNGKKVRVSKRFSTEDKALKHAEQTQRNIDNWNVRFGGNADEAIRAFDFYRDEVNELTEAGATVPPFERLVADALAGIRAEHAAREKNNITVAEGVALFLDYKRARVQSAQLSTLKIRLKRFAETFGTRPVRSVTTAEIEVWLAGLRSRKNPAKLPVPPLLGPQSRNHFRACVHALFAYGSARARAWCERNPIADLEPERVALGEPEAYTPEDAAKLMQTALDSKPELVPVLALGLFAGLRASEAADTDLAKLPQDAGEFRTNGKTGPRMAPFTAAAAAWMAAQPRRTGKAWQGSHSLLYLALGELFAAAKVEPIDNGARHSFITYRTAETRDVARVADECGNSVQTIKNHYRQLVTAEAAEKFFAIRPEAPAENVTSIQQGRASA